jgi:hypothetical protein
VNRLQKAGVVVLRAPSPVDAGGEPPWPGGAFVVPAQAGGAAQLRDAVRGLDIRVKRVPRVPADLVTLKPPRIGIYHAWGGNIDEGWTRWVLEQFEFPYARLHDQELRRGDLETRFDVVLLPDATYRQMLNGFAAGTLPDEYTGGMTARGVENLRTFVDAGGVLVAMDRSAELPLTGFGIPVRNVTATQRDSAFYVPGTILRLGVDPSHPVAYGMPAESAAFFANSPAFELEGSDAGARVVARYPKDKLLMSGWLLGEQVIADRAGIVDVPLGRGRVVLLGFRTQHRGQPHGTFKFLFNSLLLSSLQSK